MLLCFLPGDGYEITIFNYLNLSIKKEKLLQNMYVVAIMEVTSEIRCIILVSCWKNGTMGTCLVGMAFTLLD